MQIDITKLLTNKASKINVCENVSIPNELLTDSRIKSLDQVKVDLTLSIDEDNNVLIIGKITGIMKLLDDITLEPVDYVFDTDIEENMPSDQFIIDITDLIWQNIVVEIPSKVRATSKDIELSGEGWRVISEEEYNKERNTHNNPFANLGELLNTKEDK